MLDGSLSRLMSRQGHRKNCLLLVWYLFNLGVIAGEQGQLVQEARTLEQNGKTVDAALKYLEVMEVSRSLPVLEEAKKRLRLLETSPKDALTALHSLGWQYVIGDWRITVQSPETFVATDALLIGCDLDHVRSASWIRKNASIEHFIGYSCTDDEVQVEIANSDTYMGLFKTDTAASGKGQGYRKQGCMISLARPVAIGQHGNKVRNVFSTPFQWDRDGGFERIEVSSLGGRLSISANGLTSWLLGTDKNTRRGHVLFRVTGTAEVRRPFVQAEGSESPIPLVQVLLAEGRDSRTEERSRQVLIVVAKTKEEVACRIAAWAASRRLIINRLVGPIAEDDLQNVFPENDADTISFCIDCLSSANESGVSTRLISTLPRKLMERLNTMLDVTQSLSVPIIPDRRDASPVPDVAGQQPAPASDQQ